MFSIWVEECYQNKSHSALEGNKSPTAAYKGDRKALKFLDLGVITNAFLHSEERKVDKSGCISFEGRKYEIGLPFIGCTVSIVYDPADISELTIEYDGHTPWKARQLVIGDRAGQRPKLPEFMLRQPAESSRLLNAAEKKHLEREQEQLPAISFRNVCKGDPGHV